MSVRDFEVIRPLPDETSITLAGEERGEGPPIVLLHGLSATRRDVVHGSSYLARHGWRVVSYDARGHGASSPAPAPTAYEYPDLVGDLVAVLDRLELERPVLVGSSMGAATAMAFALEHPERVPALVQITPGYGGRPRSLPVDDEIWGRLGRALEEGVERFVEEAVPDDFPAHLRETVKLANRQRMERHRNLEAVGDALRVVPFSAAFDGLELLERVEQPVLVVASQDLADEIHPYAMAEEYARRLPRGELAVEEPGKSPLAWQGAQLSRTIDAFLRRVLRE